MKEELPPCCYVCKHENEENCELLKRSLEEIFSWQKSQGCHLCPPIICPLRKGDTNGREK